MKWRESFGLFGNGNSSNAPSGSAGGGGARQRFRPLRFEPLEVRSLLAAVVVDLIDSADTGRSNLDNITNILPTEGKLVFYFPATAGLLRTFVPSTANQYVNGVGSDLHLLAISSDFFPVPNDIQSSALGNLWEGENLISVTTEYIDLDATASGPIPAVGASTDEIVLDGNLTIWIDTIDPSGDGNLHPDSDTGVWDATATMSDRITADRTPSFFGSGEANSIVTVAIDATPAGTTVAGPLDGNAAFNYQNVEGNWRIDTNRNLTDGEHSAVFTFEDVAGNQFTTSPLLFLVDTQGPRVTAVQINNVGNPYDLFDPKPSTDGPTPLVNSLVVSLSDLPDRTANFLYDAVFPGTATNVGHYQVVGDSSGIIPVGSVTFTRLNVAAGQPATGYVTITFAEPLPDDRFTLTIADSLVDDAGNALDGESNLVQPIGAPTFPSGNGQPGGDFVARFTVDSRAELGVWSAGSVYLDTNGNFVSDPRNADYTNRDIVHTLGFTTDVILAGNFVQNRGGAADGFDKLAAYGRANGSYRWLVDFDNDGVPDDLFNEPAGFRNTGIPVAGNFDGIALNGDEVGVFTGSVWRFDTDHDFQLFDESPVASELTGWPVVGDFDGDGADDLGTWDVGGNHFFLSLSSDGGGVDQAIAGGRAVLTRSFRLGSGYAFIGARERAVAADMDGDGIDDLGLWVPDRGGMTPTEGAEWHFLVSGGNSIVPRIEVDPLNPGGWVVNLRPFPFGDDLFAQFGDEFGIPVVGNFDPPGTRRVRQPVSATQQQEQSPPGDAAESPGTIETLQAEADPAAEIVNVADTSNDDLFLVVPDSTPDSSVAELNDVPQEYQGDPVTVEDEIPTGDAAESADAPEALQAEPDATPEVVRLVGTEDDDVFSVMPGSSPDSWIVELNGIRQEYEGARVTIEFDGLEGTDTVTGSGSGEDEVAELWPDHVVVTGKTLSFTAENVESITVAGGGGKDTASLYDSPDDDSFWATPDWAMLQGSGFFLHAQGFSAVTANAIRGGIDTASLFGSAGDDMLIARPDLAVLRGRGFNNAAVSFRRVSAYGSGGTDLAWLFDSALEEYPDELEAADNWVGLSNHGLAYDLMAMDFDTVLANSSNASDSAEDVDPDALDFILQLTELW